MPGTAKMPENDRGRRRIFWLYPVITHWMGGVRFVFEVAKRLAERHEVTLVVLREGEEQRVAFQDAGVKVVCLHQPAYTELAFWIRFRGVIRRCLRDMSRLVQPDDILISSMFPMNVVAAGLHGFRIQILYEPFAMFHDANYQKSHSRLIWAFSRVAAALYAQADLKAVQSMQSLLTLSEYERNNVQRVYGRNSGVIYEGVDFGHFQPSYDRKLSARFEGSKVVFHSTGYDSFKGTDLVIESIPEILKLVPEARFLISHTRVNRKKIETYIGFLKRNNAWSRTEFLGLVDFRLLPAYYTLASVYVEPGHGRSMSLSSKEANACGTPSVRGKIGTEDTIDGTTGLLVDPNDHRDFVDKVVMILQDGELRDRLGSKAREEVLNKFSWVAVVRRVEQHFPSN